jgi:hypothetical protein
VWIKALGKCLWHERITLCAWSFLARSPHVPHVEAFVVAIIVAADVLWGGRWPVAPPAEDDVEVDDVRLASRPRLVFDLCVFSTWLPHAKAKVSVASKFVACCSDCLSREGNALGAKLVESEKESFVFEAHVSHPAKHLGTVRTRPPTSQVGVACAGAQLAKPTENVGVTRQNLSPHYTIRLLVRITHEDIVSYPGLAGHFWLAHARSRHEKKY